MLVKYKSWRGKQAFRPPTPKNIGFRAPKEVGIPSKNKMVIFMIETHWKCPGEPPKNNLETMFKF